MNSIKISDSEIQAIPVSGAPFDQQYLSLLKSKGVPFDGVVMLRPKGGLTYFTSRNNSTMETTISWRSNACN